MWSDTPVLCSEPNLMLIVTNPATWDPVGHATNSSTVYKMTNTSFLLLHQQAICRLQYYICLVRSIEEEQGREREGRSASNCVFSFFFFHEWEWEGERTEIAWNNWPVFLPDLVTFLAVCFYVSLLRESLEGYWRSANLLPLLPPSSRWLTFPLTAAWWEVCSIQL